MVFVTSLIFLYNHKKLSKQKIMQPLKNGDFFQFFGRNCSLGLDRPAIFAWMALGSVASLFSSHPPGSVPLGGKTTGDRCAARQRQHGPPNATTWPWRDSWNNSRGGETWPDPKPDSEHEQLPPTSTTTTSCFICFISTLYVSLQMLE